jgi:hypothetical protein
MNAPSATYEHVSAQGTIDLIDITERAREDVHDMYKQLKKNKAFLAEAKNMIQTAQSAFDAIGSVLHLHPVESFWARGALEVTVKQLKGLVDKVEERIERRKRRQWQKQTPLVSL